MTDVRATNVPQQRNAYQILRDHVYRWEADLECFVADLNDPPGQAVCQELNSKENARVSARATLFGLLVCVGCAMVMVWGFRTWVLQPGRELEAGAAFVGGAIVEWLSLRFVWASARIYTLYRSRKL